MPNKYLRKTDRGLASAEIYELASEEVLLRGQSLRNAASSYQLNYMSLQRYIKKKKLMKVVKLLKLHLLGILELQFLQKTKKIRCASIC